MVLKVQNGCWYKLWGVNGMKEWKNTLCSEFCAFLAGIIECTFWKVLIFMSFCSDFAKSLGLGHEWNGCGLNFISFRSWKCWNFVPFCYWKSAKFAGNLKIHVLSTMQNGQFCSVPQAHWVHLNKCFIGF